MDMHSLTKMAQANDKKRYKLHLIDYLNEANEIVILVNGLSKNCFFSKIILSKKIKNKYDIHSEVYKNFKVILNLNCYLITSANINFMLGEIL